MDKLELKEKWTSYKDKIKQAHPELADHDLQYEEGKDEELLSRLQEKLGKTKKEILDWLRIMG